MSIRKLNAVGLTASSLLILAVLGQPAAAADLDMGYGDAPPPEAEQKVEFGSGWYIRGDMAATEGYGVNAYQPPNANYFLANIYQKDKPSYDLSIGGGYATTFHVRGDVIVDFHQPSSTIDLAAYCFNSATATCTTTGQFKSYDALVNAYYEFGPLAGFISPYIGAGVGVAFGNFSGHLYDGTKTYVASATYQNLAWALMAGVSFDVYDHTKIDIGYRYLDNGTVAGTHVRYNEVRAGVRYMLDN